MLVGSPTATVLVFETGGCGGGIGSASVNLRDCGMEGLFSVVSEYLGDSSGYRTRIRGEEVIWRYRDQTNWTIGGILGYVTNMYNGDLFGRTYILPQSTNVRKTICMGHRG